MDVAIKREKNKKRHLRLRKKVIGTKERPRLNIYRSHLHLYAQAVDDMLERTLYGASTLSPTFRKKTKKTSGNVSAAKEFGAFLADDLKKKKITRVVFDRGGRPYKGRIRALAESLRENGIQF